VSGIDLVEAETAEEVGGGRVVRAGLGLDGGEELLAGVAQTEVASLRPACQVIDAVVAWRVRVAPQRDGIPPFMSEPKPNAALDANALKAAVAKLPGWNIENGALTRTFSFPNFVEAMGFVQSLGVEAEQKQHHPDIDIRYSKVRVALVTHDAGGITSKDVAMAETAESLASPLQGH